MIFLPRPRKIILDVIEPTVMFVTIKNIVYHMRTNTLYLKLAINSQFVAVVAPHMLLCLKFETITDRVTD